MGGSRSMGSPGVKQGRVARVVHGPPATHRGTSRSAQPGADRRDQRTVRGVTGQLPEEGPGEALLLGEVHLPRDGARRVVAPPLAVAEGVRRPTDGAGGRALLREDLVVLDPGLVRA